MQLAGRQRSTLAAKTSKNSIYLYLFPRAVYTVPAPYFRREENWYLWDKLVLN